MLSSRCPLPRVGGRRRGLSACPSAGPGTTGTGGRAAGEARRQRRQRGEAAPARGEGGRRGGRRCQRRRGSIRAAAPAETATAAPRGGVRAPSAAGGGCGWTGGPGAASLEGCSPSRAWPILPPPPPQLRSGRGGRTPSPPPPTVGCGRFRGAHPAGAAICRAAPAGLAAGGGGWGAAVPRRLAPCTPQAAVPGVAGIAPCSVRRHRRCWEGPRCSSLGSHSAGAARVPACSGGRQGAGLVERGSPPSALLRAAVVAFSTRMWSGSFLPSDSGAAVPIPK